MGRRNTSTPPGKINDRGVAKNQKRELSNGLVVSHLGKALSIEADNKDIILCHTRRRLESPVVGDQVLWENCGNNQGRVMEILPRKSLLTRPGSNGKIRLVAANINQLIIVFTIEPDCDFFLIDQFLVVCEHHNLKAQLLFNKIDLSNTRKIAGLKEKLSVYQNLDYPIIHCSVKTGQGIKRLREMSQNRTSMLAGQSGVGKSSISNVLLPHKQFQTGELSRGTGKGTHTTTKSTLYHLPEGGDLIDSPGIAIFGLANISEQDLAYGFREFQPHIRNCLFSNCRHISDKGCAVRDAVERGEINKQRYQRYLKLLKYLYNFSGGISGQ